MTIKNEKPLDPGQASTTEQAPLVPDDAAPPKVEGITPGPSPTPILADAEPKAKAKGKAEKEREVILKVDYWPEEGVRKESGSKISLPESKARELISQGKAELPFDEED